MTSVSRHHNRHVVGRSAIVVTLISPVLVSLYSIGEDGELQQWGGSVCRQSGSCAAFGLLNSRAMDFQDVPDTTANPSLPLPSRRPRRKLTIFTQDVFLKVSQALPTFRGEWICQRRCPGSRRIARSTNSARSAHVSEVSLDKENPAAADRSPDAEHRVFRKEMRNCLDQYVRTFHPAIALGLRAEQNRRPHEPGNRSGFIGISLPTVGDESIAANNSRFNCSRRCLLRDARRTKSASRRSPSVSTQQSFTVYGRQRKEVITYVGETRSRRNLQVIEWSLFFFFFFFFLRARTTTSCSTAFPAHNTSRRAWRRSRPTTSRD